MQQRLLEIPTVTAAANEPALQTKDVDSVTVEIQLATPG